MGCRGAGFLPGTAVTILGVCCLGKHAQGDLDIAASLRVTLQPWCSLFRGTGGQAFCKEKGHTPSPQGCLFPNLHFLGVLG